MITKKAAAVTAAKQNKLMKESYQETAKMSKKNLQESIGELLLYLQTPIGRTEKRISYSVLEILLIEYIEAKYLGDER